MEEKRITAKTVVGIVIFVALLAVLVMVVMRGIAANKALEETAESPAVTVQPTPTPTPEPTPTPVGLPDFKPHSVDGTEPERLISSTAIMVDGEVVEEYESDYEINFDLPERYTELEGIVTFRGDNFRSGAAYGTAAVSSKTLTKAWSKSTSGLSDTDGIYWSGSGWTGQPLIVKWPDATRKNISAMYDWAREKEGLVEVIYATLDGHVYFYELTSGEYTREPLNLGFNYKGAGALDPRGYPILYVGSGVDSVNGRSRVKVVNLIDNSVMFEFGHNETFANRGWHMFDSSPLVSAETDQLIYPGENGILYIIHLNTKYNEQTGELSVDPDNIVKWKYNGVRSGSRYWLGVESSAAIINNYIFLADNGGNLMCLDLNTLELVWVQDVLDDTNCSPVVDIEDGHPYIYISTSFHYGWRSYSTAAIPIFKIDAETGEIVWRTDYTCYTVQDLSGGVQGTIAVGKNKLSDMIFVPVARTPGASSGTLAALKKDTGEVVWEKETSMYSWSSPVDFYDADGNGYLLYCNSGFNIFLIDGKTGEQLDYMNLGGNIEASPAMYGNYAVVGTRAMRTYCIQVG
ncbi:MAG: PQQ-binding-like beta-propeller repeat protein [Oscillospiraceae bacterium]|nr:PQQ-binding-like beta-propeller repeat protein [Oscillospiraceae bacterium]